MGKTRWLVDLKTRETRYWLVGLPSSGNSPEPSNSLQTLRIKDFRNVSFIIVADAESLFNVNMRLSKAQLDANAPPFAWPEV